jgi:hypothetical protein
MRHRLTRIGLGAVICLVAGAGSAAAQGTFSANYDFIYHEFEDTSAVGAHLDVTRSVATLVVAGEFGVNRFDDATVVTFAGGGRYAIPISNRAFRPAAQFLVGSWHCAACDFNEMFIQPGFLVDMPRTASLTIRAQGDWRRLLFDFGAESAVRVSLGLVWAY